MDNVKRVLLVLILALAAGAACVPQLTRAIVKPNAAARNEMLVTNELKELLAETPRPKLVIRVSNPPGNVTEAEKFNTYINQIEKLFLESGFTVRDRALLESLMRSGSTDYKTIGEKIDTDLIVDILALQFDVPNRLTSYVDQATKQKETFRFPDNYVDCPLAKLECRVTIVNKGQLGGMFTFYSSRCDVQDLEFLLFPGNGSVNWAGNPPGKWYRSLSAPIDAEEIKTYFVSLLGNNLVSQLLEGVNARLRAARELYDAGRFDDARPIVADLVGKDPRNFLVFSFQALLDAHRGEWVAAEQGLDKALLMAMASYQRTVVYYAWARVYAIKGDRAVALSYLRKALDGGLVQLVAVSEIRTARDLAAISASSEFDELLRPYEKPAPAKKK